MNNEFVKSILNYYAAFTETRFSNRSTLSYKWNTDANLSLDVSFFSEFYKIWLGKLKAPDQQSITVRPDEHKIEASFDAFKEKLSDALKTTCSMAFLKDCIDEEKKNNDPEPLKRGIRSFNLQLRKVIESIVHELQKNEIENLKTAYPATRFPSTTFNVTKFSQDIYDTLQETGNGVESEEEYFNLVEAYVRDLRGSLTVFDLYLLLKNFVGQQLDETIYLFFGSVNNSSQSGNPDYPLYFLEVSFDSSDPDHFVLAIPRDLVLINTPAINSFEFDKILSTPRACSFVQAVDHLKQVDDFLITEYKLPQQEITLNEHPYRIPGPKDTLPMIQLRFGFQVVRNEDKRILDYSELMTAIEKGSQSKFIDFVNGYLNGNVANTVNETDSHFRETYPPGTPRYFMSDNPLPLNSSQKKILSALGNPKNKIVVVDGPPGTGKSHTIAAITYWANQNDRSVVVTSHKKEALDVVDRMLTDKFKDLHQHAKPSIMRITKSYDNRNVDSFNVVDTSLSLPVIDAATNRVNDFRMEAVEADREKLREAIEQSIQSVLDSQKSYPNLIQNLHRYFQLEEDVANLKSFDIQRLESIACSDVSPESFEKLKEFIGKHTPQDFKHLSLTSLSQLYKRKDTITGILEIFEKINAIDPDEKGYYLTKDYDLSLLDDFNKIIDHLEPVFEPEALLYQSKAIRITPEKHAIQQAVHSFDQLTEAKNDLSNLAAVKPTFTFFDKKYKQKETAFKKKYPKIADYWAEKKLSVHELLNELNLEIKYISDLKSGSQYKSEFIYSLTQRKFDFDALESSLSSIGSLKLSAIIEAICEIKGKKKAELTISDAVEGMRELQRLAILAGYQRQIQEFIHVTQLTHLSYRQLFDFLNKIKNILNTIAQDHIAAMEVIQKTYGEILKDHTIDFANLESLFNILHFAEVEGKIFELIQLSCQFSKDTSMLPEIKRKLDEYNRLNQRITEYHNDIRLKNLHNHHGDISKIKLLISKGKRLSPDQAQVLFRNFACIIAEPEAIFRYFPMTEDLIDILIFDEASQVSIAHSISLILRAKQVIVFGDKYQYGAVSAVNVSKQYAGTYFKRILDSYCKEYNAAIPSDTYQRMIEEESEDKPDEEIFVPDIKTSPSLDAEKEWLRTFSIRTSTLSFCEAIANYHTSLTEHFRSFKEIIDYSNKFFYEKAQIPLIINRLRTKPIDDVLRFIKVDSHAKPGNNMNLAEIEAIQKDIESMIEKGFKGTIGIITSFREQKQRTEEHLRRHLPNFHRLKEEHKLTVWFVGDVQGEERDVVYYTLVQDKKHNNGDLRAIYPTPNGAADDIKSLKMQRLNVGFSRAKNTMVFVHSMDIDDYMDTRLGDALKHYNQVLQEAKTSDHFIVDEKVFESPKEKELYTLLTQTQFFETHRNSLLIIPQFDIGQYIRQEYQRYIPNYRVDFLVILSGNGQEKSLILEYDGLEYHTKDPRTVRSLDDFRSEYLEYDIQRQLELEAYGYHFLRINKFSLLPKQQGLTKIDMLNDLLEQAFA